MKLNFYKQKNYIFLISFYLLAFCLAVANIYDFGIHIEEKFHRLNGHYWLNYIGEIFGLSDLQNITKVKLDSIGDYTLSNVSKYNKYGIILDVPAAYLEIFLKFENILEIYYFKHLLSFTIFLLSSYFFYRILNKRYKNFYISFFGLILFVTTPRILGDSFLYKDVLFLSFFTISLYYFLEALDKLSFKNLIFFSLFSSFAINLRIFAILMPIFFIFILFIQNFNKRLNSNFFKRIFFYIIFLILFTYIFWPYLWASPIENFLDLFKSLKGDLIDVEILYFNNFFYNTLLPDTYLINWLIISNPFPQIILFFLGYLFYTRRFIKRFVTIKNETIYSDLWRSESEKKDFILFFIFSSFFFIFLFFNAPFYNGWRLVYFFNVFIIYFGINIFYNLFILCRKKKIIKLVLISIAFLQIFYSSTMIYISHPYQSIYFNNLLSSKFKDGFEGDYYGLATKHFFEYIAELDQSSLINIGVASHTPLQRGLEAIPVELNKKFRIVGQEYHLADYIFKNNISEVNSRLNNKYEIPKNFSMIYVHKVNKTKLYEVYKLKN